MKLSELEVGKIYGCKLINQKVLVIEQDKIIPSLVEGEEPKSEKVKLGKWMNLSDDGIITYYYQEIFDGQLGEIKEDNNN